jgi:DNA-binding NarL/FixJ family response regulator
LRVKNNTISTLKNRLLQKVGITNEIELIEIGKILGIDKINQIENE